MSYTGKQMMHHSIYQFIAKLLSIYHFIGLKKILVWLSGWVDSAVAAYLLQQQWYEVVGWFMKNYVSDTGNCTTYSDAEEAIKVAKFLWIEIISFDLQKEYNEKIIEYIYDGYQKWITPNPDVLCNSLIKFDVFLDKALELGFDAIATGHYARIKQVESRKSKVESNLSSKKKKSDFTDLELYKPYRLLRGVDYNKDQSYFLSWLNQFQLSKSLFPLGEMTKPEIRMLAKKIWLPNAERKDSQWLCFIGNIPMKEFLKKRLPIKPWDIVLLDGTKVGEHEWAYFFTIGQSRGLDINKKAYVVAIDIKKNLVIVSYDKQEPQLIKKEIIVEWRHRIGQEYHLPLKCSTKIRYRQEPNPATMKYVWDNIIVEYTDDQRGIAPGQTLTAYIWDECIGSGTING